MFGVRAAPAALVASPQALTPLQFFWLNHYVHKIYYAGDTVFTGSDIARAVLGYANALAKNGSADTVRIPVYDEDGRSGESVFLLGPASQIAADSVERDWAELTDSDLIERLQVATSALAAPRPTTTTLTKDELPDFDEF